MKNKVLKTIGYIVGITWLFTACALDDEVYGMTMLFINVLCMAYLALFSWEITGGMTWRTTKMKMTKSVKNHFTTAQLLLAGVEESMGVEPDKWGIIPPEHSKASIIRRCVQVRQEILQVQKALEEGRCNDG